MGDRKILETYLNSASKNTPETDSFRRGTKSLLTSFILEPVLKYIFILSASQKHISAELKENP